ncbi:hypothetical protein BASA50_002071 [Batrachochytrium salamandrivorans]|uniref:Uncharacterized protein n=1 Tax=Batrachochytrium salamandrivorans TaxID=1357716 RepID=A0ABQ8FMB4_9FUNG|nr:hypothetical protein BASA62_006975 [Batrachochytrium salamandrivorans]KAH6580458.1 hypothetical protein BASA60_002855 [Batrachochytrium salamandrivorans]KAH6599518.1 hypothetical protein BASA61_002534 [Batrachochytrium salamandrivorans]KAH6600687.1 hypothetical protein BASA50_002071 [Batrachochytrium salamandrivorans]KAH9271659.1 hypothetical protein BASA83_006027 [Batrachochytrium salamandrivorans]
MSNSPTTDTVHATTALIADAEESHGLFQFTDMADDLFEIEPHRQRHYIDHSYAPRNIVDGWFRSQGEQVATNFNTKHGPSLTLNTIEHSYTHGDYTTALALSQAWLAANTSTTTILNTGSTKLNSRDVLEIAARCELKLGRPAAALAFMSQIKDTLRDPGLAFFHGKLLRLNGCHSNAVEYFLDYLDMRGNDYTAWVEISHVFQQLSTAIQSQLDTSLDPLANITHADWKSLDRATRTRLSEEMTHLAYLTLQKAFHYLQQSYKHTQRPINPFSMAHERTEVSRMTAERDHLISQLGIHAAQSSELSFVDIKMDKARLVQVGFSVDTACRFAEKLAAKNTKLGGSHAEGDDSDGEGVIAE